MVVSFTKEYTSFKMKKRLPCTMLVKIRMFTGKLDPCYIVGELALESTKP